MKNGSRLLFLLMLFSIGIFSVSCDEGGEDTTEEETQLNKLKGTWTLQSVNNDGDDRTDEYPGMTLTISGTYSSGGTYNYTSVATSWPSVSPWNDIDTWKFKSDAVTTVVVRQSDLQNMTYQLSNNDNTLQVSFDYPSSEPGFNNGRVEKVDGSWSFTFSK